MNIYNFPNNPLENPDVWSVELLWYTPSVHWEQVAPFLRLELAIAEAKAHAKINKDFVIRLRHYETGDTIPFEALG